MSQDITTTFKEADIKGYEFKHGCYVEHEGRDIVLVKENIHLKDGRVIPNVRRIEDYPVYFWITRKQYQNHKDKKEWEEESRCQKFKATRSTLVPAIQRAMGRAPKKANLRHLARSQYLYGCDVTSPVLLKQAYQEKWPDCVSESTVAALDIETDVVHGTDDIICIGLTFKKKAFLVYTKEFIGSEPNAIQRTHEMFEKLLGDLKNERGIELEVIIVDTPGQACYETIKRAHEWKPDFISIYNIGFDLKKMIDTLENEGYDVGDVFSDPSVPKQFRQAKFKEDNLQKMTATGKSSSKHAADLWHVMSCPSSFYFICSMATYAKLRAAKGKEPSYALDDILFKTTEKRKLRIAEVEYVDGFEWHQEMQKHWKIQYGIYNIYDEVALEEMDEATGDLARALPGQCGVSEYSRFGSIPRRTADDMHFVCRKKKLVIATTSDQMKDENDQYVLSMKDWINKGYLALTH